MIKSYIKTTIEQEYPKLMESNNKTIVLFHKANCGIVVKAGNSLWEIGEYMTNWEMSFFHDFNSSITLQNI